MGVDARHLIVRQRSAVVLTGGAAAGKGHLFRGDGQHACGTRGNVRELVGHILVRSVENFEFRHRVHGFLAGTGDDVRHCAVGRGSPGEASGNARHREVRVRRLGEQSAVVDLAAAGGHHRDGAGVRRHLQSAIGVGNLVTIRDVQEGVVLDNRIARHIVAVADQRLVAGQCHTPDGITRNKSRVGVRVFGQGCAVILFGGAVRRDGQGLRRHRQSSVTVSDIVTSRYRIIVIIYACTLWHVIRRSSHRLTAHYNYCIDSIARNKFSVGIRFLFQGGSVIHFGVTIRCDGQILLGNRQCAILAFDIIAVRHKRILTRNNSAIMDRYFGNHIGNRICIPQHAFHLKGDGVVPDKACAGVSVAGEVGAVIDFGGIARREVQFCRDDPQGAVDVCDVVTICHGVARGIFDDRITRHIAALQIQRFALNSHAPEGVASGKVGVRVGVIGQKTAVIDFGRISRRDSQGFLRHL